MKFVIGLIALVFLVICISVCCMLIASLADKICDIIWEKWVRRKNKKH